MTESAGRPDPCRQDPAREGVAERPQERIRVGVFNRCESSNNLLLAVQIWASVHPLLRILPVDWDHSIPYGLLHSPAPSKTVARFLEALHTALRQ